MSSWTGRITKAVVAASIVVAGAVIGIGTAHADPATACRSAITGHRADVFDHISIDSCYYVMGDGYTIWSFFSYLNNSGSAVTYCAHAIDVNNPGVWAHDFGCEDTTAAQQGVAYPGAAQPYRGWGWQTWATPRSGGTYVISAGFWLNGHYYGDVQSPRTTIGAH
ncbi:MAG TPA: hypothetical protein VG247_01705 [Pseudonocardiaceae bacterium]|jgi:hypothetical protein|nr:hypothetical protein [Pseudonocardiaceae bacterium]